MCKATGSSEVVHSLMVNALCHCLRLSLYVHKLIIQELYHDSWIPIPDSYAWYKDYLEQGILNLGDSLHYRVFLPGNCKAKWCVTCFIGCIAACKIFGPPKITSSDVGCIPTWPRSAFQVEHHFTMQLPDCHRPAVHQKLGQSQLFETCLLRLLGNSLHHLLKSSWIFSEYSRGCLTNKGRLLDNLPTVLNMNIFVN